MPPYFNLSLQFSRRELRPSLVEEFDRALERAGVRFSAGYWEATKWSQKEINAWNQKKLEEDFELGDTEHYSHDYKQSLYRFGGYSQVRGYWNNRYPDKNTFSLELILPEREVLTWEDCCTFQPERAGELLALAKGLWQFPAVRAIQTGLEVCSASVPLGKLRLGAPPSAALFAILEPDCTADRVRPGFVMCGTQAQPLHEGRPGRLLLRSGAISYTLP